MNVKIKRLDPIAVLPSRAKPGDAGQDMTAISKEYRGNTVVYGTGIAVEVPQGYVGLLFPRSSLLKQDLILSNHVGVIDSGYRGEIKFVFKRDYKGTIALAPSEYNVGDRIGQLIIMPYPAIEWEEVNILSDTERGTGGWGSSG